MRRFLAILGLYVGGYLPLAAVVGVLEGALHGQWGLTPRDWEYQLGAFVAYLAIWLLLSAPFAAALLLALLRRISATRMLWRAVLAAMAGVAAVCFGATIVAELAAVLGEGSWYAPLVLVTYPIAFLGAAAIYGIAASGLSAPRRGKSAALGDS